MTARRWTTAVLLTFATSSLLWLAGANRTASQATAAGPRDGCPSEDSSRQGCFVARAADGRYQEIIDDIESGGPGLSAYERYFLGISYFGLSGRTGAASLRCFWTSQAKGHLESFLEDRQKMMEELDHLGNADELKYTYIASRVLESARQVTGCDESGEPLSSLERHAHTFLGSAVEDLFLYFGTGGGAGTPGRGVFNDQMDALRRAIQGIVSSASRIETNYELTQVELDVAQRDVDKIAEAFNQWQADAVRVIPDEGTGIPKVAYGDGLEALLSKVEAERQKNLTLAAQGGEIGAAKAVIDRFIAKSGASGMQDYHERRAATVAAAQRLAAGFAEVSNQTRRLADGPGFKQLLEAPAPPADAFEDRWNAIAKRWREVKPACNVTPNKWYCR